MALGKVRLTEPRYDRKLLQLSGERWRASAALGYANGKRIFYAPYECTKFYHQMNSSNLFKVVSNPIFAHERRVLSGMERYECTYRVNYNKQYLEDILDEECKGKKKLSNATLKKKDDSWEMDFHVMGPVKHVQRAREIWHPIKATVAVKDGEISVVVPQNKVDPGIIFFYGGLNVLPLIFCMIALRAMYPDYALLWYVIFAVLAIVVVWAFGREQVQNVAYY